MEGPRVAQGEGASLNGGSPGASPPPMAEPAASPVPPRLTTRVAFGFQGETDSLSFVDDTTVVFGHGRQVASFRRGATKMLFSDSLRTEEQVRCLVVSPDGKYVAVCEAPKGGEAQVALLDARTLKRVRTLSAGMSGAFVACSFSADGTRLVAATAAADAVCTGWDVASGAPVFSFPAGHPVRRVSFNPADCWEVATTGDSHLRLWRRKEGGQQGEWALSKVPGIGVDSRESPEAEYRITDHVWWDGRLTVGTTQPGAHTVLVVSEGPLVTEVAAPEAPLALAVDKRGLVCGGGAGVVYCVIHEVLPDSPPDSRDDLPKVPKPPEGSYRISGAYPAAPEGRIGHIAVSPSGSILAAVVAGDRVAMAPLKPFFDGSDLGIEGSLSIFANLLPGFHTGPLSSLSAATRGPLLASCSKEDRSVRVWNAHTAQCLALKKWPEGQRPLAVALSPTGVEVAVGCETHTAIFVVKGDELREKAPLELSGALAGGTGPLASPRLLKYSPGGASIAAVTSHGREVVLFEKGADGWACRGVLDAPDPGAERLEWGADGGTLLVGAVGGGGASLVIGVESFAPMEAAGTQWVGPGGAAAAISPATGLTVRAAPGGGVHVAGAGADGGGGGGAGRKEGDEPLVLIAGGGPEGAVTHVCAAADGAAFYVGDARGRIHVLAPPEPLARSGSLGRTGELPPLEDVVNNPSSPGAVGRPRAASIDGTIPGAPSMARGFGSLETATDSPRKPQPPSDGSTPQQAPRPYMKAAGDGDEPALPRRVGTFSETGSFNSQASVRSRGDTVPNTPKMCDVGGGPFSSHAPIEEEGGEEPAPLKRERFRRRSSNGTDATDHSFVFEGEESMRAPREAMDVFIQGDRLARISAEIMDVAHEPHRSFSASTLRGHSSDVEAGQAYVHSASLEGLHGGTGLRRNTTFDIKELDGDNSASRPPRSMTHQRGSTGQLANPRLSTTGGLASMYRQRSREVDGNSPGAAGGPGFPSISNTFRPELTSGGGSGANNLKTPSYDSQASNARHSLGRPDQAVPVQHRPSNTTKQPVMVVPARMAANMDFRVKTSEDLRAATAGLFQAAGGLVIDANKNTRVSVVTKEGSVKSFTWHDRLKYRIDTIVASGQATFYLLLVAVCLVVMVGASLLYVLRRMDVIKSDQDGDGDWDVWDWSSCAWETWTLVIDTGTHTVIEDSRVHKLLGTCYTLVGVMFFIVITGLVVDSIRSKLANLEKGKTGIVEEGHFLVLGWNDKVAPLLRQLAISMISEGGGTIVVMADREKAAIEEDLSHVWEGVRVEIPSEFQKKLRVVVRSGSPQNTADLIMVSAPTARAVVLLSETGSADKSDSKLMRCVLSLSGLPGGLLGHVVVELRDVDNLPLMQLVGGDHVEPVTSHDIIGRMMMKSARQMGLTSVFEKMIGFEGHEFYLKSWDELVGVTFKEISFRFQDAVPIGIKMAKKATNGRNPMSGGNIVLCPDDGYQMQPGDELLVLAEDDDTYWPEKEVLIDEEDVDPPEFVPDPPVLVERVLMCGWRRDMQDLIALCDEYCAAGSEVHILNDLDLLDREKQMMEGGLDVEGLLNISMIHHFGNPSVRRNLEVLPLSSFSYILVLAEQSLEEDVLDSDSQMLATLLLVRDIQQRWSRMEVRHRRLAVMKNTKHIDRCHAIEHAVEEFLAPRPSNSRGMGSGGTGNSKSPMCKTICEVLDTRTREMIVRNRSIAEMADYVESPALISRILAMIAVRRETRVVLEELLGPYGPSIVICPATLYLLDENGGNKEALSFWEMAVRVRLMGRILLGYTNAVPDGGKDSKDSKKRPPLSGQINPAMKMQRRLSRAGSSVTATAVTKGLARMGSMDNEMRSGLEVRKSRFTMKDKLFHNLKNAKDKAVETVLRRDKKVVPTDSSQVDDFRIASRTVINPSKKMEKRTWEGMDLVVLCPPAR